MTSGRGNSSEQEEQHKLLNPFLAGKMQFHKADSKWGLNNMSKVLAIALLLLLSLQILTWSGQQEGLIQLPCPIEFQASNSKPLPPRSGASASPNSYFPETDADVWECREHRVDVASYADWRTGNFTDEQALCAAHRQSKQPLASGTPRVAFLFLTRGPIPLEHVWRRFFRNHEEKYSIYVHAADSRYSFPNNSLFYNRTVPSQAVQKFEISLVEALRRLLAFALLDTTVPNAWFHLACDASVPIRGFDYVYNHITNSNQSFVESFYPTSKWWRHNWIANNSMILPDRVMRKGEFWITLHRRHAGVVVGDRYVFPRFKHNWYRWGLLAEVYVPTLMAVADPEGISHHSLVYVNWLNHTKGASSPVTLNHTTVTKSTIEGMQQLTANAHGFYQVDKRWNDTTEKSCVYNGVPNSPCFLFARKFVRDELVAASLLLLSPVLGYE